MSLNNLPSFEDSIIKWPRNGLPPLEDALTYLIKEQIGQEYSILYRRFFIKFNVKSFAEFYQKFVKYLMFTKRYKSLFGNVKKNYYIDFGLSMFANSFIDSIEVENNFGRRSNNYLIKKIYNKYNLYKFNKFQKNSNIRHLLKPLPEFFNNDEYTDISDTNHYIFLGYHLARYALHPDDNIYRIMWGLTKINFEKHNSNEYLKMAKILDYNFQKQYETNKQSCSSLDDFIKKEYKHIVKLKGTLKITPKLSSRSSSKSSSRSLSSKSSSRSSNKSSTSSAPRKRKRNSSSNSQNKAAVAKKAKQTTSSSLERLTSQLSPPKPPFHYHDTLIRAQEEAREQARINEEARVQQQVRERARAQAILNRFSPVRPLSPKKKRTSYASQ